jgi:hypothetical protein
MGKRAKDKAVTAADNQDEIKRSFEKLTSFEKLILWLVMNPERGRKILEEMTSRERCSGTVG